MASVERHHLTPPFFAGGEHLHDRRVGDELYGGPTRSGVERHGGWRRRIDNRSRWSDHFDGFESAVILRKIIGKRAKNRFVASTEGRVVRQVYAFHGLRTAT